MDIQYWNYTKYKVIHNTAHIISNNNKYIIKLELSHRAVQPWSRY